MRLVFVNQRPPAAAHVAGVRVGEFARAMARRGHRVVLLTEPLRPDGDGTPVDGIEARLSGHDWATPFPIECARTAAPLLEGLHRGRLPFGFRQAVVAASFVARGGVFPHWRDGCGGAVDVLARIFKPELVWATFGVTDVWNVARDLAHKAGCPWVADLKDNWENFIPPGLRAYLAGRYADAGAFTVLSDGHRRIATARFRVRPTVIYSGFHGQAPDQPEALGEAGPFRILVAGSTYDGRALATLVRGVAEWLSSRADGASAEFDYVGNDNERVAAISAPLSGPCRVTIRPFVSPSELAALRGGASVIVYPRHAPMLYHHKFIESLSTGRPVLCFPGETAECRDMARDTGAPFFPCDSVDEIKTALSAIEGGDTPRLDRRLFERYSWDAQAGGLEGVFRSVLAEPPPSAPGAPWH